MEIFNQFFHFCLNFIFAVQDLLLSWAQSRFAVSAIWVWTAEFAVLAFSFLAIIQAARPRPTTKTKSTELAIVVPELSEEVELSVWRKGLLNFIKGISLVHSQADLKEFIAKFDREEIGLFEDLFDTMIGFRHGAKKTDAKMAVTCRSNENFMEILVPDFEIKKDHFTSLTHAGLDDIVTALNLRGFNISFKNYFSEKRKKHLCTGLEITQATI